MLNADITLFQQTNKTSLNLSHKEYLLLVNPIYIYWHFCLFQKRYLLVYLDPCLLQGIFINSPEQKNGQRSRAFARITLQKSNKYVNK